MPTVAVRIASQTPMSAVIYAEAEDGSVEIFKSGPDRWRADVERERRLASSWIRRCVVERSDSFCATHVGVRKPENGKSLADRSRKISASCV